MKVLYIPLYRTAVSYTVSFGRRWSILEHLLLIELSAGRSSVDQLAKDANVPVRLIIEALINMLQANWIEVRATAEGVFFAATSVGRLRSETEALPVKLKQTTKWISLCVDRLTGTWLLADDLDLVYERDLPEDAKTIEPRIYTYDRNDPGIREMLALSSDESLEPAPFNFSSPSRPYARVVIGANDVEGGLPRYAPLHLRKLLMSLSESVVGDKRLSETFAEGAGGSLIMDSIGVDDIVVGGAEHLSMVRHCLDRARTHFVLHSCFLSPNTTELLLPDFEKAARRKVRIDLLWGLHVDPEDPKGRKPISDTEKILDRLGGTLRPRVQLSPSSSGSHAKLFIFDDRQNDDVWTSVIGSCNFLSSSYDSIEISLRSRSQKLATRLLGHLVAAQLPASNAWPPMARRLDRLWDTVRRAAVKRPESGSHRLTILADQDHYACVTTARDRAQSSIVMGCDLYGFAAETSVLVPMERAAELRRKVRLFFQRSSKRLLEEGRSPNFEDLQKRGIQVEVVVELHGKFLAWDDDTVAITSFNWMSTVVEGTRARGAELGMLDDRFHESCHMQRIHLWFRAPIYASGALKRRIERHGSVAAGD